MAFSASVKRKHKVSNKKVEILNSFSTGENVLVLAKFYNVGNTTIHDTKTNKRVIRIYIKAQFCLWFKRKKM